VIVDAKLRTADVDQQIVVGNRARAHQQRVDDEDASGGYIEPDAER
jgi:hypothetical protein